MNHKLTEEQKSILDYEPGSGEITKILAFAGTGKTTTLVHYTKARPDKNFLYVAFNKSVQMEATKKFGSNVSCKTAHALAFAKIGYQYKDDLILSLKISQMFRISKMSDKGLLYADFKLKTLTNFLISDSINIEKKHIPPDYFDFFSNNDDEVNLFLGTVGIIYYSMKDREVKSTHDFYLKLFQLSKPKLDYDFILLDEAQDVNPVIADIVLRQATNFGTPVILVGDIHQQIYSFRGARGVLSSIEAKKTMYLTKSFRFGENVASVANMILKSFKNEKKEVCGSIFEEKAKWNSKKHTVIARTNAVLFDKAVSFLKKATIGFVGPIEGYRLDQIRSIHALKYSGSISDPFIKSFNSYHSLKKYIFKVKDIEISSMCKVVEKYGRDLPKLIKTIKKVAIPSSEAEIVLTTVHKSKGLEWNNVFLCDDFAKLIAKGKVKEFRSDKIDEINLTYVAVTRAAHNLKLDPKNSLVDFINLCK